MLNPSYLISTSICFNSANVYHEFYKKFMLKFMLKFIFNLSLESVLKFFTFFLKCEAF